MKTLMMIKRLCLNPKYRIPNDSELCELVKMSTTVLSVVVVVGGGGIDTDCN